MEVLREGLAETEPVGGVQGAVHPAGERVAGKRPDGPAELVKGARSTTMKRVEKSILDTRRPAEKAYRRPSKELVTI